MTAAIKLYNTYGYLYQMEDIEKARINNTKVKKHPREKSNILSHLFFCWQLPLILDGWKQKSLEKFYTPLPEYDSRQLGNQLEQLWQTEESLQKKPSLSRALFKLFGCRFIYYGLLLVPTEISFLLAQTFFMKKLLDFYTPNQTSIDINEAYIYGTVMTLVPLCRVVVYHWTLMELGFLGMKIRIARSSLIYRKALKLKQCTLDKVTVGHLLNLLSNDVKTFDASLMFMHWLWLAPLNLVLGCCYIYYMFGLAGIAGVSGIVISSIVQTLVTRKFSSARYEALKSTDHRLQIMNDVIRSIQAVKVYAWEKPFREVVRSARKSEMEKIATANYVRSAQFIINYYTGKLSVFFSTLVAILTNQKLTSQFIFSLSRLYELFQLNMIYVFEYSLLNFVEIKISIERIQEYLLSEQHSLACSYVLTPQEKLNILPGITITDATVKWDSPRAVLENVNFKVSSKDFVGVIGAAGSGKSTLLSIILREVPLSKGNVSVEGTISYASQEPWVFSGSIKQNILFGENFDPYKYSRVVKVCGLEHDLSLFAHGDQTLVGERGVMLSGGQKARINLARAVYRDADIYLFDDPLSAVDVDVAQLIFNECFCRYLQQKCVVLVTHQVTFLRKADKVYLIDGGVVECTNSVNLVKFASELKTEYSDVAPEKHKLQTEVKEEEGYRANVYLGYIRAAGYWLTFLPLGLLIITQVISNSIDYFLSFFVNLEENVIQLHLNIFTTYHCLYIYVALVVLLIVSGHTSSLLLYKICHRISKKLHDEMLMKILSATMTFFNINSSGRILNRFSVDTGIVDQMVPYNILMQTVCCLMVAGTILLIISNNYWMVIFTVVLLVFIFSWSKLIKPINQDMKRVEAITRSVLFAHFSCSVDGLSTIRAFGAQDKIAEEFDRHQNSHSTALYISRGLYSAFGFWIDVVCVVYYSLVIFTFFFLVPSIGNVGLAISIASSLIEFVQFTMTNWSELQGNTVSVERVLEYGQIESEPDDGTTHNLPENWPVHGDLSFHSVFLKYLPDAPFVLRNVSFAIKSGTKIGIIGRTGAGKTSLSSVLFRLFPFDGTILIDGVDTKSIPLSHLRSKISIIPQEPFLLLGTLRKNIDPFDEYQDAEIWRCLDGTGLKEMVSKLGGLECRVSERGSNFSVGERQLICLVRVMLKNNKVVLLDEATANVDLKTDELIQATIKTKFRDCTVLTIAHRLNTIMDYDQILVMDGGLVVEFGYLRELLKNKDGYFFKRVEKYGKVSVPT